MKDMRLEELLNKVKADAVEYYTYSKVTYDKVLLIPTNLS